MKNRISDLKDELKGDDAWNCYFTEVTEFITDVIDVYESVKAGLYVKLPTADKKAFIDRLYRNIIPAGYDKSFLNPDVAVSHFGTDKGRVLSAIYAELMSMISYAYEADIYSLVIRLGLFLELYGAYEAEKSEGSEIAAEEILAIYRDYAFDHSKDMTDHSAECLYGKDNGVAGRIIDGADLTDTSYLYDYGEYISDNELKISEYLASLPPEDIESMASVYVEGYIKGFEVTGKDVSIKNLTEVRYCVGFERVVKKAAGLFKKHGLDVSLRRSEPSFVAGRKLVKVGYFSTIPNKQFEADHENDRVLFFDKRMLEHKLTCFRNSLEERKTQTSGFGGPAVIEVFGEKPTELAVKQSVIKPDNETNKLFAEYTVRSVDILNEYVKGEERSFTIIAFPIPAIGKDFEAIFKETVRLNTLDYTLYRDIQQTIIDSLDKADHVKIKGRNGNETDLKINLWKLKDPDKETIFENCVADVNIPVGEVFTSPVLEGSEGLLHVKNVYLNEMPFKDLRLRFKDGRVTEYSCENYPDKKDNEEYIKKYLLFSHKTLPIGEFAIGTNTTAYMMMKRYNLESVMPILI
ncbi:MAG: aminopeptidase, partial [Lachnospiraceae bacterium]|nr:aminopeptidase [Lachnospiraceae bacterium]